MNRSGQIVYNVVGFLTSQNRMQSYKGVRCRTRTKNGFLCTFAYGLLMQHLAEKPHENGQLVTEIQTVEGFANQYKTKDFPLLIGSISKSVFASANSIVIISHYDGYVSQQH